ncbi:unnamed protein product [Ostreobium quekettii]|uniref:Uncharacterized protein n=1 Tax=Ostreobium quekettii TaxID=121088 RepID=A0A8S1IVQ8_9CHLO|nr:unnamed protein product [Ostreobium quekettii]|eukprot:evm.model.scf_1387.2 EVM.evm.TU.scf_1387.2   scf_1387:24106-26959(+)
MPWKDDAESRLRNDECTTGAGRRGGVFGSPSPSQSNAPSRLCASRQSDVAETTAVLAVSGTTGDNRGLSLHAWECMDGEGGKRCSFQQLPVRVLGAPKGQLLRWGRPMVCTAHINAMALFSGERLVVMAARLRPVASGGRRTGPTNELQLFFCCTLAMPENIVDACLSALHLIVAFGDKAQCWSLGALVHSRKAVPSMKASKGEHKDIGNEENVAIPSTTTCIQRQGHDLQVGLAVLSLQMAGPKAAVLLDNRGGLYALILSRFGPDGLPAMDISRLRLPVSLDAFSLLPPEEGNKSGELAGWQILACSSGSIIHVICIVDRVSQDIGAAVQRTMVLPKEVLTMCSLAPGSFFVAHAQELCHYALQPSLDGIGTFS